MRYAMLALTLLLVGCTDLAAPIVREHPVDDNTRRPVPVCTPSCPTR